MPPTDRISPPAEQTSSTYYIYDHYVARIRYCFTTINTRACQPITPTQLLNFFDSTHDSS